MLIFKGAGFDPLLAARPDAVGSRVSLGTFRFGTQDGEPETDTVIECFVQDGALDLLRERIEHAEKAHDKFLGNYFNRMAALAPKNNVAFSDLRIMVNDAMDRAEKEYNSVKRKAEAKYKQAKKAADAAAQLTIPETETEDVPESGEQGNE